MVLSFLCRALVPVGYMPDLAGGRDGKFALALCTVGSTSTGTILLDLNSKPHQPSPSDHFNNQDCPFAIAVSQAVMPSQDAPVLVASITHHPVFLPQRRQALPPLPALGPPLGSRAPPSHLG